MEDRTRNDIYYGQGEAPVESMALRAGPLTLLYELGDLRNVRFGEQLLLSRLYAAVRDRNWATIPAQRRPLVQEIDGDSFRIVYEAEHRQGEIHFVWRGTLTGTPDGTLTFDFEGEALSTFARNRIGFCLLHPAACAGVFCTIRHGNGTESRAPLPQDLSPDQPVLPFAEMRALTLHLENGLEVRLDMEGDTFEMEDQRNWTDASYKTFCTPLRLPFPVIVPAGTRLRQTVRLSLTHRSPQFDHTTSPRAPIVLQMPEEEGQPVPALGFGCPWQVSTALSELQAQRLKALGPAHLRLELILNAPNWERTLREGWQHAQTLGVPLELALLVSPESESELQALRAALSEARPTVCRWLVLPHVENPKRTPDHAALLALVSRLLENHLQKAPLAAGTNSDFIFLNQFPPPVASCDALAFAINPQAHAFDSASLMETLPMQGEAVLNARRIGNGLPVVVSPITLKPRFNPYATIPLPRAVPPADSRQRGLFGAAWTAGSLVYLLTSGAASLTYYETVGASGVLDGERVYPLYHVFAELAPFAGGTVARLGSSAPERVVGLHLAKNGRERLLLANLTPESQEVVLPSISTSCRSLDETNDAFSTSDPEAYRAQDSSFPMPPEAPLSLLSYSIARLDIASKSRQAVPERRNPRRG